MPQYKRPPIVEAIIDVRFEPALTQTQISKLQKKLIKDYPVLKDIHKNIEVFVKIGNAGPEAADFKKGVSGKRFETHDAEWVILLYPQEVTLIRLAPYPDWKPFFNAFKTMWETLKVVKKPKHLTRLAVRYINRIDIPLKKGTGSINIADYLNVGVVTPEHTTIDGYEAIFGVDVDKNTKAKVRTATHEPALPKTAALLLDVDLFIHSSLPDSNEEMYKKLGWLRKQKNELFEKFTTKKSKELFDKDIV